MIGQAQNVEFINTCIAENKLPRFMIIRGEAGSGKKTFVQYIKECTNYDLVWFTPSIDNVRNLINLSYQQTKPILYVITDCDKLSNQGANALLKIAEEPPENAHIIALTNDDSLLGTIKSRGTLIVMSGYTHKQKEQFAQELNIKNSINEKIDIADNLGDLVILDTIDFESVNRLCQNIVDGIGTANIGSVLKICKKLKLKEKDDDSLIDVAIFIKILAYKYYQASINGTRKYAIDCWNAVFEAKRQLMKSYNKQYIIDEMLLKLRSLCK